MEVWSGLDFLRPLTICKWLLPPCVLRWPSSVGLCPSLFLKGHRSYWITDFGVGGMQLSPEGEGRPRWKAGWQSGRSLFPRG